jgi:hypothetical protein
MAAAIARRRRSRRYGGVEAIARRLKRASPWELAGLGLGVGGLLWLFARGSSGAGLELFGDGAYDPSQHDAWATALGNTDAAAYSDAILQVAGEQQMNPAFIYGFGEQESQWGATLSPPGPGGTGDGGHGHGLVQIDDRSHGDWLAANNWQDPYTNLTYGFGSVLKPNYAALAGQGLSGAELIKAAVASFNTGLGNVQKSLAAGIDPDTTTAGGAYSQGVMGFASSVAV